MAEELRLALSLLGSLAVGAVVLHGIWTVRKTSLEERKQAEQQKQQETPEIDEEEQEIQALKIKQMEIDFSDLSDNGSEGSTTGLPVVDMNVDSIYDKSKTEMDQTVTSEANLAEPNLSGANQPEQKQGEMQSFLSHARQLNQNPDVEIQSSLSAEQQGQSQQAEFAGMEVASSQVKNVDVGEASDIDNISSFRNDDDDTVLVEGFSAFGNIRDDEVETEQLRGLSSGDVERDVAPVSATEQSEQPVAQQTSTDTQKTEPKQEVLILFVDKPSGEMIEGAKLLPLLLTLGFKFGEMDFFHRHEQSSGHGEILFSLANMYNPGTFDIDHMEQVSTRGLSIFMTLPNAGEALQTFNMMHNAAKKIADEFGARVLDAERQPLDVVRVRNYVDKIRKF